jgi:hypothetical protein
VTKGCLISIILEVSVDPGIANTKDKEDEDENYWQGNRMALHLQ